jgi:hypothetical protein
MKHQLKYLGIATAVLAVTFSGRIVNAQNTLATNKKPGIYIGKLEVQPSVIATAKSEGKELVLKRLTQSLDTQFISALSSVGSFNIVERKRKSDIEQEQGFASVAVDVNDKDAAKLGEMAGAKYVLLPQIDGFEDIVDTQKYKAIDRVSMRRKLYLSATATIVDTTTGQLLPGVAAAQLTQEQIVQDSRSKKFLQGSDSAVVELAKKMANKLCQSAIAVLRPPKVLAVNGRQIMINRGIPAGFRKGLKVDFFAVQNVKDNDSGEIFSNEVPVGKGYIIRTDTRQSYVKLEGEDLGVAKGCTARLTEHKENIATIPDSAPGGAFPKNPELVIDKQGSTTTGSSEKPINFDLDNKVNIDKNVD